MGWFREMIDIVRIVFFSLLVVVGLSSPILAQEVKKAEQWEIDMTNLIKEKNMMRHLTLSVGLIYLAVQLFIKLRVIY